MKNNSVASPNMNPLAREYHRHECTKRKLEAALAEIERLNNLIDVTNGGTKDE